MTIVHLVQFRYPYADDPDRVAVFSTEDRAIAYAFKCLRDFAEEDEERTDRPPPDLTAFEAAGDWKGALETVLDDGGNLTIDKLVVDEG